MTWRYNDEKDIRKAELRTEPFDAEDVITASGGFLQTVAEQFENLIDNLVNMINSAGH